jgi:hypothetical protein
MGSSSPPCGGGGGGGGSGGVVEGGGYGMVEGEGIVGGMGVIMHALGDGEGIEKGIEKGGGNTVGLKEVVL